MIYNVVEFKDIEVSQIMTPRTDIISASIDSDYETLYELFKSEQFSRIPIFEDNIDHIVGILNIKKWMFYEGDASAFQSVENMRQPLFTYESKKTADCSTKCAKASTKWPLSWMSMAVLQVWLL